MLWAEDGALLGAAIVAALSNIRGWPDRNRLRFTAARLEDMLGAMGLL